MNEQPHFAKAASFANETIFGGKKTITDSDQPLLAGRYRVVRPLGQGGMGSVFLAEDEKLAGRPVAIKMLPAFLVTNKRAYRQIQEEALVSLKLSHSNIATVRAFDEDKGNPFLVMDYIAGQSLDDLLVERGKLSEEETVKLLGPVADALDYAHEKGVVHRDVKPGNVIVAEDGRPYVLDFGIAREIHETMMRMTGKDSSGTLPYMSPEQLGGDAPKASQDVYSFAAMAYECLTGHAPFYRGKIDYQIVNKQPEPLPPTVRIGSQVMAGLAKKPEERPPTCRDVLKDTTEGGFSDEEKKPKSEDVRFVRESDVQRLLDEALARARKDAEERQRKEEAERIAAEKKRLAEEAEAKRRAEEAEIQRRVAEELARKQEAERQRKEEAERLAAERERLARLRNANGLYRVIDLTDGSVTHLDAVPSGGWTEEYKTRKLVLRRIEAGSFDMGSPTDEEGRFDGEPCHRVTLTKPYYIGVFEVTQAQWERVMGSNPSKYRGPTRPVECVSYDDIRGTGKGSEWPKSSGVDAGSFLGRLRAKTGDEGYDLPTEAQWEHACRAGTTGAYAGSLDEMGWYGENLGSSTHGVGTKRANAWGLYDMHGNVWEWCADWYGAYGGDATDPRGSALGGYRVSRGGGWSSIARGCRSAYRDWHRPGYGGSILGFRLCCSAGPFE